MWSVVAAKPERPLGEGNLDSGVVERALEQVPISEMVDVQPTELLSLVGETDARDNSCKTN